MTVISVARRADSALRGLEADRHVCQPLQVGEDGSKGRPGELAVVVERDWPAESTMASLAAIPAKLPAGVARWSR